MTAHYTDIINYQFDPAQKISKSSAYLYFEEVFNRTQSEIAFNDNWKNGTEYLDGMVEGKHAIQVTCNPQKIKQADQGVIVLMVGQTVKGVDNYKRKFLYHATPLGGVVVFERYTEGKGPYALVANRHGNFKSLELIKSSGAFSEQELEDIFGRGVVLPLSDRIQTIIERSAKILADVEDHSGNLEG